MTESIAILGVCAGWLFGIWAIVVKLILPWRAEYSTRMRIKRVMGKNGYYNYIIEGRVLWIWSEVSRCRELGAARRYMKELLARNARMREDGGAVVIDEGCVEVCAPKLEEVVRRGRWVGLTKRSEE